jgi:hypothetical protein
VEQRASKSAGSKWGRQKTKHMSLREHDDVYPHQY